MPCFGVTKLGECYAIAASVIFFSSIILFCFSYVEFHLNVIRRFSVHCTLYQTVKVPAEVEIKIVLSIAVWIMGVLNHLGIFVILHYYAVVGLMDCEYVFHLIPSSM